MPTTTTNWGIVKPTSGAEPADLYGVATRLADSTEAALDVVDSVVWTKYRKTATQATATGTAETMGQSGETYGAFDGSGTSGDTDYYTESNGVITIAVAGVYRLEAYVEWASNATGYRLLNLIVSSVPTTGLGAADIRNGVSGLVTRQYCACTLSLGVGDTISAQVAQASGGNLNVAIGSFLAISRIGTLAA